MHSIRNFLATYALGLVFSFGLELLFSDGQLTVVHIAQAAAKDALLLAFFLEALDGLLSEFRKKRRAESELTGDQTTGPAKV